MSQYVFGLGATQVVGTAVTLDSRRAPPSTPSTPIPMTRVVGTAVTTGQLVATLLKPPVSISPALVNAVTPGNTPAAVVPPASGVSDADFATACQSIGGSVVGSKICQLADGAQVTVDATGNSSCVNAVGQCAAVAAGTKKMSPVVLGAAALAALMLLR